MPVKYYATIPASHVLPQLPAGLPIMLTAASQEKRSRRPGVFKIARVPSQVPEIAVDPGGFVAATHGGYKFTWETYRQWLFDLGPRLSWAAFPDLPCEKALASDEYAVRARQEQTLRWCYEFWSDGYEDCVEGFGTRLSQPWAWVPTVQGRSINEYVWMAEEMAPYIVANQQIESEWLATATDDELEDAVQLTGITVDQARAWGIKAIEHGRIGIGSLCQRPAAEVVPIVQAVSEILPDARFHLWGIDIRALRLLMDAGLTNFSFDSASYNGRFKSDIPKIDAERAEMGLSQSVHAVSVMLPRRQAKIAALLAEGQRETQQRLAI